ncbi:MAG: hypothetical protein ABI237_17035 [Ginsengibacter sp.]
MTQYHCRTWPKKTKSSSEYGSQFVVSAMRGFAKIRFSNRIDPLGYGTFDDTKTHGEAKPRKRYRK